MRAEGGVDIFEYHNNYKEKKVKIVIVEFDDYMLVW